MQTIIKRYTVQLASLLVLSASLAACGGGSGGAEEGTASAADSPAAGAGSSSTGSGSAIPVTPPVDTTAPDVPPVANPVVPVVPPTTLVPVVTPPTTPTTPVVTPPTTPPNTPVVTPPTTPPATPVVTPPVAANHAPMISGSPSPSVTSGQAYNFVPATADADADHVQFSISSKPTWATFDVATGRLWGIPTSANAGSYEEIEISVTDGKASTKLPQFAISVVAATPTTRSVHIAWQPPTVNADGSTLTDLNGYRILYGTQPGVYTNSVTVNGAGLASYTIENLQTGKKYYFAMVAVNSAGAESDNSQEVVLNLT